MIPKIEDGNNFGVSVQEDTLAEIQQVEVEANNYLEQVSRYYVSRAKLVTKVCSNLKIYFKITSYEVLIFFISGWNSNYFILCI